MIQIFGALVHYPVRHTSGSLDICS